VITGSCVSTKRMHSSSWR